jgi:hypothetical protein
MNHFSSMDRGRSPSLIVAISDGENVATNGI